MPLYIVLVAIQLALVIHVLKTGRAMTWIFIILIFPFIGGMAYFFVEVLSDFKNSRTGHSVRSEVSKTLNPDKGLREASRNFSIARTTQNALTLGDELLGRADFEGARDLFKEHLAGVHANDPELLQGLAKAHYGLHEYQEVIDTLNALKEHNPDRTTADGHLLYARALEGLGHDDAAISEYETLVTYYAGPEPLCHLARLLRKRGETLRAHGLYEEVVKKSEVAGRHFNKIYREWVALAKREVRR
ncbi:PLDc N-terminal domain-containing protein [Halomonas sp. SCS19]|uniref:tetratricopeptide repeat protein n=1 Tax=Halomonas sp. SCS19 TaxID=2950870 RepID=UPI0032DFCA90